MYVCIAAELRLSTVERSCSRAEAFALYFLIPEERLKATLDEGWVKNSPDPIPELAEELSLREFMEKRLRFRGQYS